MYRSELNCDDVVERVGLNSEGLALAIWPFSCQRREILSLRKQKIVPHAFHSESKRQIRRSLNGSSPAKSCHQEEKKDRPSGGRWNPRRSSVQVRLPQRRVGQILSPTPVRLAFALPRDLLLASSSIPTSGAAAVAVAIRSLILTLRTLFSSPKREIGGPVTVIDSFFACVACSVDLAKRITC